MDSTKSSREVFERTRQEHEALREKLHEVHGVLAKSGVAAADVSKLLCELRDELLIHFKNEESDGFFDEVTTIAPRLSHQADHLCTEHEQMMLKISALCDLAEADEKSDDWLKVLNSDFHDFSKQLMHHESEENQLLQQTFQDDIGNKD